MNNWFLPEAAAVGAKEAVKLLALWIIARSCLSAGLLRYFLAGIALASGLTVVSFFIPPDLPVRLFLASLSGHVFFVFFLSSLVVLYQYPEGPRNLIESPLFGLSIFLATVFYASPDIIGSSMFLRELAALKDSAWSAVYFSSSAGFLIVGLASAYVVRDTRLAERLSGYFGPGQALLALALVKFLGGGTMGFGNLSLVPAVQRGIMKFFHDLIHQSFVFIMVPDHPMLSTTTWNFVGFFFGPNIAIALSLLLLVLMPAFLLYRGLVLPVPVPEGLLTGAERRMHRAGVLKGRARGGLVTAVFIVFALGAWYTTGSEEVSRLEMPVAKPVVEDKGLVIIPLSDPTMDLRDGDLHKFALEREGKSIRILVIKKEGGRLAVCLDACEICPPEGYGRTEGHVVCVYCMTPIPIESLGKRGGCNPIPLEAEITGSDIRLSVAEIEAKLRYVTSNATGEMR